MAINACLAKMPGWSTLIIYMGHVIKDRFEVKHVSEWTCKMKLVAQQIGCDARAYDQDNILCYRIDICDQSHHQLQDKVWLVVQPRYSASIIAKRSPRLPWRKIRAITTVEVELLEAGVVLGPAIALQQQICCRYEKSFNNALRKRRFTPKKNRWHKPGYVNSIPAWALNIIHIRIDLRVMRLLTAQIQTMSAPFDGFIAKLNVKPGDTISDGQVLVELDERECA